MPFLPNFADLKGIASSLNPLNAFSDPTPVVDNPTDTVDISSSNAQATAGPGPSSQAARIRTASPTPPSLGIPIRPSLIKTADSSSVSSDELETGRRRSSGASVTLVDADFIGDDDRPRRAGDALSRERRSRRMSTASDMKRIRKAPTDTYIIVRPPPTSAKNPLNLQIQLVVRESRARTFSTAASSSRSNSISTDLASIAPSTPGTAVDIPISDSTSQFSPTASVTQGRLEASSHSSNEERDQPMLRRRSNSIKSSSTTMSGSARKRVEPMFNLAVHNVMQPTVVTDAATDVKVAKFLKRSLDVLGVGVLEPAEVWLAGSPQLALSPSRDDDSARRARPVSMIAVGSPLTPSASDQSDGTTIKSSTRNSLDMTLSRASIDLKNVRLDSTQDNPAKKLFGKVFKRKTGDSNVSAEPRRSNTFRRHRSPSPNPPSDAGHASHLKGAGAQNGVDTTHQSGHPTFGTTPLVVRRPSTSPIVPSEGPVTGLMAPPSSNPPVTLGSSPTPSFLGDKMFVASSSRPVGYTWSVRKWAKKNHEGWAAHLTAAAAAGLEMVNGAITAGSGEAEDDVVFEWVKQRAPMATGPAYDGFTSVPRLQRRIPRSGPPSRSGSRPPSTRGEVIPEDDSEGSGPVTGVAASIFPPSPNPSVSMDPRPAPVRRVSGSVSPRRASPPHSDVEGEPETSSLHTLDITAEEDSDPEDSETPWTCSVLIKKTGYRQLLGTITPAPHHPKVVGMLKIPLRLDPVSLQEVRGQGKEGQDEAMSRVKAEVCLTEENLKDVVCTTALWLVAREEFGGLGRKRRSC